VVDLEGPRRRRSRAVDLRPRRPDLRRERRALRLELQGRESVLVETGQTFVIPADTPFRGYRWPRDGAACLFLAVAPADATFSTR